MTGRTFNHNWKVSVFSLLCLVAFLNLGFWQLDRQQEKQTIMAERDLRLTQAPVSAGDLASTETASESDLMGLPVGLSGRFRSDVTLLLDNIVLEGRVGFEVHQLFADKSGRNFLINRGFVPMGRTRQDPVQIPDAGTALLEVVGEIYQRGGAPLQLRNGQREPGQYPAIVQQIDVAELGGELAIDIFPYVIRLKEDQPAALPRFWPDTVIPPEKHLGYAIQWFAMAMAVVIAWLFFSFRNEDVQ